MDIYVCRFMPVLFVLCVVLGMWYIYAHIQWNELDWVDFIHAKYGKGWSRSHSYICCQWIIIFAISHYERHRAQENRALNFYLKIVSSVQCAAHNLWIRYLHHQLFIVSSDNNNNNNNRLNFQRGRFSRNPNFRIKNVLVSRLRYTRVIF